MPRLSITLTESQSEELNRIAAKTGASKQSMIGLAITDWLHEQEWKEEMKRQSEKKEPYERYVLESYLGEYVDEFDVDAIEEEVTKFDFKTGKRIWRDEDIDLDEICQKYDLRNRYHVIVQDADENSGKTYLVEQYDKKEEALDRLHKIERESGWGDGLEAWAYEYMRGGWKISIDSITPGGLA